ncbi:DUF5666 domain-containing protein [Streptomyces sp. NPDC089919]|uniref:DUF5666 domain-containing protein n=1 Tax=Streptomyces sp. NPDC089919 TaxID=3155188 RepID=UPI003419B29D
MARRRTSLEKRAEAGEDRFTPFEEVFAGADGPGDGPFEGPAEGGDAQAGTSVGTFVDADCEETVPATAPGTGPADDPERILAEPPDTRDISAELAAPPRPRLPWLTLLLSGGVVAGLAFTGGALVEKGHLKESAGAGFGSGASGRNFTAGAAGAAGDQGRTGAGRTRGGTGQGRTGTGPNGSWQGFGGGGAGGTGGPAAGAGLTTGTVKLVDGTTLYVTDAQGEVVKVTTDARTRITRATTGKVADLQPGQTVTVRGSQNADGDLAATTVAEGGAAGSGGGRG